MLARGEKRCQEVNHPRYGILRQEKCFGGWAQGIGLTMPNITILGAGSAMFARQLITDIISCQKLTADQPLLLAPYRYMWLTAYNPAP